MKLIFLLLLLIPLVGFSQVTTQQLGGTTLKVLGETVTGFDDISTVDNQRLNTDSLYVTEYVNVNDAILYLRMETLIDDGAIVLPTAMSGFGTITIGDSQEFTMFYFTTAGAVTLVSNTANVVSTDTDANLCIFDSGTTVTIRNRLGSTLKVRINITMSAN